MKKAGVLLIILLLILNLAASYYLYGKINSMTSVEKQLRELESQNAYFQNRLDQLEKYYQKVNFQEQAATADQKLYENYRKKVFNSINHSINSIVAEKPVLGARSWYVTGIKLITPDIVYINYEDGHIGGALLLRLVDLEEDRWQVLYQFDETFIFKNDLWNIDWDWKP